MLMLKIIYIAIIALCAFTMWCAILDKFMLTRVKVIVVACIMLLTLCMAFLYSLI